MVKEPMNQNTNWLIGALSLVVAAGCGGGGGGGGVAVAPQPTVVLSQITVNPINLGPGFPGMKTEGTFSVSAIGSNSLQLPNVEINVACDSNAGWVFPSKLFTNGTPAVFRWVPGLIGNGKITVTAKHGQIIKTETINTVSVNPPTLPLSALNIFFFLFDHASEYSVDITPLTDPRGTYYAAMVWNGGYAGLQRDGSRFHDQLQFSVWNNGTNNARIVTLGDGVVWTEFGGEGTGIACSLDYPWNIQTTYRFEMKSEAVTGGKNVSLFVTNMSTSVTTFIATLFEPFTGNFNYYNSFVEQFHRVAPNCLEQPVRAYAIKRVMAKIDGNWTPLSTGSIAKQGNLDTICSNVEVYQHNFGLVLQIGGQSMSDPYVASGNVVIP